MSIYWFSCNYSDQAITLRPALVIHLAFRYGNLEMNNLSAIAIALTGVVSILFFVVASLNTDTKGLIDSAVEKFDDD